MKPSCRQTGPMRLLVVIGSLNRGGAETHLLNVLPRLNRERFAPEVFVLAERGELAGQMENAGVPVSTPWIRSGGRSHGRLFRVVRLAAVVLQLWWRMMVRRPRIAHFFLPESYCIGAPVSLLAGVRRRVMSRRSRNHYQDKSGLIRRMEHLLHRTIHAALGNSQAVVQDLIDEGMPRERVSLLYNAVSLVAFHDDVDPAAMRRAFRVPTGAVLLVTVANLIPYKGHADLLDAMAAVADMIPGPWHLLCVGRDDGIGAALRAQTERLGLADKVSFIGPRPDVPAILQAADIAVLASHEEGFSNAVLEGMAAGLPMVVTDVGGNAEAVRDGQDGYVVPARDPARLGEAILRLIAAPDDARRMGSNGRDRVAESYSIDACIAAYEAFYEKLSGPVAGAFSVGGHGQPRRGTD